MNPLTLLLADSRFPSGSYAHSLGLEQAVNDGLRDVPAFIRARQRHVAAAEAAFAVAARRAAMHPPQLARLDREWAARTPAPALRDAGRRLGSQLLRAAAVAFPAAAHLAAYRAASRLTPRPIALGVVAADLGVCAVDTALLALYDDAATVASAALKLLPLDPAVTARWLAELAPDLTRAAHAIAGDDDGPLPSPTAVAIEISAPIHLEQRERLFAS
jgi:urease accessory protein